MSKDCKELKKIIEELIADIDDVKNIWRGIRKDNPSFEQISEKNWESKKALLWMHGATDTREAVKLERWLYASPPFSDTEKSNALDNYFAWCEHIDEDGNYTDFGANDLPKPYDGESLIEYMIKLSQVVEERGWRIKRKRRALKSFLHFLRKDYHQEAVAFIEHIFPEKIGLKNKKIFKKISLPVSFPLQGFTGKALIELRKKTIIRKIRSQVHSISHEIAGAIIKELAYQCAFGRSNARHHAGEALALIS